MTFNPTRSFGDRGSMSSPPAPPQLPAGYLQKGYFDEKGNIYSEFIQQWAKDIANGLSQSQPRMTSSQLRGAFFTEVRRLEKRLEAVNDFDKIRPDILKLNAYVADRKKKNKVPPLFENFIAVNVRWASKGPREFVKGFVPHFECVVAYYPEFKG